MKRLNIVVLIVAVINFAHAQHKDLNILDQLAGSWQFETSKSIYIEQWTKLSNHTFEGIVSKVDKATQDSIVTETLRLVEMSGDIFYMPYVAHNPRPVAFKLITNDPDSLVFENRDHDFPQRIIYIFRDKNNFTARVAGEENGKERAFELQYKRQEK